MADIIHWPAKLLRPASSSASIVPFSRSGGRSLGGIERTTRTDCGFWRIALDDVTVFSPAMRRTWNALRTHAGGKVGVFAIPAWSFDSAPYVSGEREAGALVPHDDGTSFDDGALYSQGAIDLQMASFAALGATVITLRAVHASGVAGIRFSYRHALYETGPMIEELGNDVYRVPIFPAVRMPIPAGAQLEADMPTCLCHLADDRGMDISLSHDEIDAASVEFVEAVDFWNDLALGEVA